VQAGAACASRSSPRHAEEQFARRAGLKEVASGCDVVIGYFGSIYRGRSRRSCLKSAVRNQVRQADDLVVPEFITRCGA
jgi:hypothetical protein